MEYKTQHDCPDADKHTPCPKGYTEWFEWAEKMEKTHTQIQCSTCGFYAIWVKKEVVSDAST